MIDIDEVKIIDSVIKRIERPENWCQRIMARNKEGQWASACADDAVAWCAGGAFLREKQDYYIDNNKELRESYDVFWKYFDLYKAVLRKIQDVCGTDLYYYNDRHTHGEVINLLETVRDFYIGDSNE